MEHTSSNRTEQKGTKVTIKEFAREVADWLVERQRPDGTLSGVSFQDNRAVRGLLGAYEITGDARYRDAALAWGAELLARGATDLGRGATRVGSGMIRVGRRSGSGKPRGTRAAPRTTPCGCAPSRDPIARR